MGANYEPRERIKRPGGEILKVATRTDSSPLDIAEVYFSVLEPNAIRGWKLHTEMTVNAFVPSGEVKFVIVVDGGFEEHLLGPQASNGVLSIEPNTWFGFQGGSDGGVVLNLADTVHDSDEGRSKPLDEFAYKF